MVDTPRLFSEMRTPIFRFPPRYEWEGERYCVFNRPRRTTDPYDEGNLTGMMIASGYRIAAWYPKLLPTYYKCMPLDSGLLLATSVPSKLISDSLFYPGDIDILAIPYEKDKLILSKTLAVEVKVVRASYRNQGKSPNQFGYSQVEALQEFGFPHVAVAHLIISDSSPREEYKTYLLGTCGEGSTLENIHPIEADPLPTKLTDRVFGRLLANSPSRKIGLLAYYMDPKRLFIPSGKRSYTAGYTKEAMVGIARYYQENVEMFLQMPRYSPEDVARCKGSAG